MADHIARRLSAPGPKRMLALDGGGARGIVTLGILAKIEEILANRYEAQVPGARAAEFRLSNYFDVIGGTSVGSLIATQLALGQSVAEVRQLFEPAAVRIFTPSLMARVTNSVSRAFVPSLDVRRLRGYIWGQVGNAPMGSERLQTGLAVITKRLDTGSVWILTNNPGDPYFAGRPAEGNRTARIGNGDFPIQDVLQASTAAPSFFAQAELRIFEGIERGLFVDGGVSPHNAPALHMLMLAGISGYNLGGANLAQGESPKPWKLGADNLLIVSVGTGGYRYQVQKSRAAGLDAMNALQGMVSDGQQLGLTLLQWMSQPRRPVNIDRVIKDLRDDLLTRDVGGHALLSFQRYDASLERADVIEALGRTFTDSELEALRDFTSTRFLGDLHRLGDRAGTAQVAPDDFPRAFDAVFHAGAGTQRTAAE